ncbi:MAG: surface-adhesin E family protein [Myxococcaceae bacterium]
MNTSSQRVTYTLCTLISLVIFSPSSHANWTRFNEIDTEAVYVDLESIKAKGAVVSIWRLTDFIERQEPFTNPHESMQSLVHVDCQNNVLRNTYTFTYENQMGTGQAREAFDTPNAIWEPVIPDSVADSLAKMLCTVVNQ